MIWRYRLSDAIRKMGRCLSLTENIIRRRTRTGKGPLRYFLWVEYPTPPETIPAYATSSTCILPAAICIIEGT